LSPVVLIRFPFNCRLCSLQAISTGSYER
jgi:hypothetical protein